MCGVPTPAIIAVLAVTVGLGVSRWAYPGHGGRQTVLMRVVSRLALWHYILSASPLIRAKSCRLPNTVAHRCLGSTDAPGRLARGPC